MSLPGGGLAVGGGGLGVVGLAIYLLIAVLSNGSGGLSAPLQNLNDRSVGAQPAAGCTTARAANMREDCRIVGYVNSIQAYWTSQFRQSGRAYAISRTVFFDGSPLPAAAMRPPTSARSMPGRQAVYIDLGFFDELRTRFGATGGPFAQAYVLAHEYGHHVQDQLGLLGNGSGQAAPGRSVRTELQADCFAGVWANHAAQTGYLTDLTEADIADGLNAAAAVGDDRIQQETQGRIDRDTWTHGSQASASTGSVPAT